ncbi:MAG: DUF58 domain-containing protein [Opitutaceae bacterium]
MSNVNEELKHWHDWTHPDFFQWSSRAERRIIPLFMRQLVPARFRKTKLTFIGWILIVVAMGIGSAAYNTSSNILFMTLSLLLSSLILSGILSQINFFKLKWALRAPQHLQVGEVGMAEVDVTNTKRVFPTMSVCFQVGSTAGEAVEKLYLKQALSAKETSKLEWTFVPQQRGLCKVYLSGVTSQFPFGFLQKEMGQEVEESVLVWPERIDFSFDPHNNGQRFLSGHTKRKAGMGNDLINLRPYVPGDPPRLVHWKATARLGELMIRQLAQEGEAGYHLQMSPDASVWDAATFETLCSLVCSLAETLHHAGRLETISVVGQPAVVIRSLRDLHDFFDVLAVLERGDVEPAVYAHRQKNLLTFRPLAESAVAIYIDEKPAGQSS